jgi:hypothetical protein
MSCRGRSACLAPDFAAPRASCLKQAEAPHPSWRPDGAHGDPSTPEQYCADRPQEITLYHSRKLDGELTVDKAVLNKPCGAYDALHCSASSPAVRSMVQLQALAVADLALRDLATAASGCSQSAACGATSAPVRATKRQAASIESEQAHATCPPPAAVPSEVAGIGSGSIQMPLEATIVVGHHGDHIRVHPTMLRVWPQVGSSSQ